MKLPLIWQMPDIPMPVRMFLYFGYVDEELAGLKNAVILYRLAEAMTDHSTAQTVGSSHARNYQHITAYRTATGQSDML